MQEFQDLGHMNMVDQPNSTFRIIAYLSSSTKLRVVFHASGHISSLKSLNDLLLVGPIIHPKLYRLQFRTYR